MKKIEYNEYYEYHNLFLNFLKILKKNKIVVITTINFKSIDDAILHYHYNIK